MLKKRIIPILLMSDNRLVKTRRFSEFRDVGDPVKSSAVYNSQYADELVFLNIERENRSVRPLVSLIENISEVCFMPLAVGGGLRSFAEASILIKSGADKVVINSAVYADKLLVRKISDNFGSQAIVVAMDVKRDQNGNCVLVSDAGRKIEKVPIEKHLQESEDAGAGEFLIQSVDRDGTMTGYDIPTIQLVCQHTSLPVIGCGGAGNYEHLKDAFLNTRVSALGCGSLFNFSDSNPIRAKAFLSNYGLHFKNV